MTPTTWPIAEPNLAAVFQMQPNPLAALADLSIGAVVLRGVFPPHACETLVRRFIERGLMYDPAVETIPNQFVEASVREGGYGRIADPTYTMFAGQDPK